ncbi:hypothetical protein PPL_09374 [Heterostelium album PN500]|uniref:Uncharacterized protein n=1 Tax=Heterostelium pallidum (strain ATCC 26659 / Pp 5 / PN500) TaxID=670386 RepID=D3BLE0_HETP5|nr:hypothetical protein PPL_09374 [Heterostelium album PN500]EFA77874.1 hypothetical protein PPL_09374 [Heterostelium album PN500]|eukprot:XP_020430002.1 hypothetical protein PPL_09374 [Heterostelium album PN500]
MKLYPSENSFLKYFDNQQDLINNNRDDKINLNFYGYTEIIKYLIHNYHDMVRIVDLSTVSKQFHQICSSIISNNIIPNIMIKSRIDYIGSQFCLFKNAPFHLRNTEINHIPKEHKINCFNNLQSLTIILITNRSLNINYFEFKAPNLKNIKIFYLHKGFLKLKHIKNIEDLTTLDNRFYDFTCEYSDNIDDINTQSGQSDNMGSNDEIDLENLLKHLDNDDLESIEYNSTYRADFSEVLQCLNQLKKRKPHLSIKVSQRHLNLSKPLQDEFQLFDTLMVSYNQLFFSSSSIWKQILFSTVHYPEHIKCIRILFDHKYLHAPKQVFLYCVDKLFSEFSYGKFKKINIIQFVFKSLSGAPEVLIPVINETNLHSIETHQFVPIDSNYLTFKRIPTDPINDSNDEEEEEEEDHKEGEDYEDHEE